MKTAKRQDKGRCAGIVGEERVQCRVPGRKAEIQLALTACRERNTSSCSHFPDASASAPAFHDLTSPLHHWILACCGKTQAGQQLPSKSRYEHGELWKVLICLVALHCVSVAFPLLFCDPSHSTLIILSQH